MAPVLLSLLFDALFFSTSLALVYRGDKRFTLHRVLRAHAWELTILINCNTPTMQILVKQRHESGYKGTPLVQPFGWAIIRTSSYCKKITKIRIVL